MRARAIILILVGAFGLAGSACAGTYSGGTGEPNDPYRIATANDLNDIGNHVEDFNKCFVMVNDINLADYNGTEFNIIGDWSHAFAGVFDGNGHTIINLTLDVNTYDIGLFAYIEDEGIVQDLCLEAVDIKALDYVGGIAARNRGLIQNCHVHGSIEGEDNCGGIAGFCYGSDSDTVVNIRDCSFRGKVTGTHGTGGIVGFTDWSEIVGCYAIVELTGGSVCGGMVGYNMGGNFTSCFAKGSITCLGSAGGFAGTTGDHCGIGGLIRDCYANVTVGCSNYTGGFAGQAISGPSPSGPAGQILNCYCSGRVVYDGNSHTDVGAFIGEERSSPPFGVCTKCFWDSDVNPDVNGIGNMDDPNVIGKTTVEMMAESTFTDAGWDFVEVWDIGENQTYPFLRVYPAGDIDHDDRVNWADVAIMAEHWLEAME
jgi:hypothetical protein